MHDYVANQHEKQKMLHECGTDFYLQASWYAVFSTSCCSERFLNIYILRMFIKVIKEFISFNTKLNFMCICGCGMCVYVE
jgi:hypothetical protein